MSGTEALFDARPQPNNVLIEYPFPVCDGEMIARLAIPKWFTRTDAERLKRLIDTLVTVSEAIITFPETMTAEDAERFREEWTRRHG